MMDEKGLIQIYCGPGKGKTSVAIGQAVRAVGHGKRAIVIQFLKGKATTQLDYLSALEPDIRLFRFEKKDKYYEDLTEEEKQEENLNIRNGLNFARKVLITEECELLILDEILSALELGIVSEDEVIGLIEAKDDETELILTGTATTEALKDAADRVVSLEVIK
ncbi:MAG TPA: cob(I)yrinic acid a,c-diamide adenosyltransferase [Candidatus Blautia merdigallinarum]|uniref:Cob(I)yrinic acid a,c-diamide adenosyltransferase n=1 Tax=Candidatus Blautia merdigallinarum TaxID=2838495 RepID=A0A9D2N3R4_9FIRM|nr:cob(I)yrinic acid a,c-diamide adenosyltransferase [Candidatus Blautia merdigallinarum]